MSKSKKIITRAIWGVIILIALTSASTCGIKNLLDRNKVGKVERDTVVSIVYDTLEKIRVDTFVYTNVEYKYIPVKGDTVVIGDDSKDEIIEHLTQTIKDLSKPIEFSDTSRGANYEVISNIKVRGQLLRNEVIAKVKEKEIIKEVEKEVVKTEYIELKNKLGLYVGGGIELNKSVQDFNARASINTNKWQLGLSKSVTKLGKFEVSLLYNLNK
jgi:hypothetical protein